MNVIFRSFCSTVYAPIFCVMPPASPPATFAWRILSSSEVLPWSTWPSTVTTGGRGVSISGLSSSCSTRTSSPASLTTALKPKRFATCDGDVARNVLIDRRHRAHLDEFGDDVSRRNDHRRRELLHGEQVRESRSFRACAPERRGGLALLLAMALLLEQQLLLAIFLGSGLVLVRCALGRRAARRRMAPARRSSACPDDRCRDASPESSGGTVRCPQAAAPARSVLEPSRAVACDRTLAALTRHRLTRPRRDAGPARQTGPRAGRGRSRGRRRRRLPLDDRGLPGRDRPQLRDGLGRRPWRCYRRTWRRCRRWRRRALEGRRRRRVAAGAARGAEAGRGALPMTGRSRVTGASCGRASRAGALAGRLGRGHGGRRACLWLSGRFLRLASAARCGPDRRSDRGRR